MRKFQTATLLILSGLALTFLVGAVKVSAQNDNDIQLQAARLKSADIETRRDALHKLRTIRTAESSDIASLALNDSVEIVRATAPFAVLNLPPEEAAARLQPQLRDSSEFVRRETAYALGETHSLSAAAPLIELLRTDKMRSVQAACAVALGNIGDVAAIDALLKILTEKFDGKDEFTRRSAARAIGQIAQITDAQLLIAFQLQQKQSSVPLSNVPPKLVEKYPVFKAAAQILIKTLQNPRETADVKRETAFALGEIRDASAIPVLQASLQAEDYYLARISAPALEKINRSER